MPFISNGQSSDSQFLEMSNFQISVSPYFTNWLEGQKVSLVFTNTLGNRLFFVGLKPDGTLSVSETRYDRCMGLKIIDGNTIYVVTRYQIWRLENALPPGRTTEDGFDRLYIPKTAYTTGSLNIHDVDLDRDGNIIFVNTRFACLAAASELDNFIPFWKPPFINDLQPGDPCHLNGLAMKDGRPAFVTCFSRTQTAEGWRDEKLEGGSILDVASNEVILSGLCMPHSPTFHNGDLWITHSGTGHFGRVDLGKGCFEPLAFAPGFLRGLDFCGEFAVVGSSKPRHSNFFSGLPLEDNIKQHGAVLHRGLFVFDLRSGDLVHWLSLEGVEGEIYDVVVLPGVRRARAIGFETEEIQQMVTIGPYGRLFPEK